MNDIVCGRIWKLPENVDTDALAPGAYMQFGIDVIAKHCLKRLRPEFASEVRPGDVIVAGEGFGIGSSREQAAAVLRHLGVAAVLAPSFGGLYFRNAFNLGLLALVCQEADQIQEGDALTLSPSKAKAILTRSKMSSLENAPSAQAINLALQETPAFLLDMVQAGGLIESLKRR
jgi:3-isopropylmalate/(R)-2-methylmalate dehydratase small subunit